MKLNSKKCELIGLHTGDGTLYQTNRAKVWEIRGSTEEKDFYGNYIPKLLYQIFKIRLEPKYRAGGTYGIQTCNKEIINFLISVNFPVGSKARTVKVPDFIFKTNKKNQLSFLRGLFDTDGCLSFDKGHPRIDFCFASKDLRDTLKLLFEKFNFRPTISEFKGFSRIGNPYYAYKVRLFGKQQTKRFFKEVSPKNSKHLNKYLNWKRICRDRVMVSH